jgi:hypothetical protein
MPRSFLRSKSIVAAVLGFALIDLFPRHGPPNFRYTGSDPAHEVWNLGWPMALAIYDPQSGIHLGPFLYVVVPLQVLFILPIAVTVWFNQRRHNPSLHRTATGSGA